jgi:hypothetical protein
VVVDEVVGGFRQTAEKHCRVLCQRLVRYVKRRLSLGPSRHTEQTGASDRKMLTGWSEIFPAQIEANSRFNPAQTGESVF